MIKKYIAQEPPYLMRQIRELQWEEIKTKNSEPIIFEDKGHTRGNKNILLLYFPYWPESQKIIITWYINLLFCWTVIYHQSPNPFPSTSVGALGLFTFLPQSTVHNMRVSELCVPIHIVPCYWHTTALHLWKILNKNKCYFMSFAF